MANPTPTEYLQVLLDRHREGDPSARAALLEHSLDRLRVLARKMFRRQSDLRAFEQTDDVVSKTNLKLLRAVEEVRPDTVLDFLKLSSQHVRYVLLDLARKHKGERKVSYTEDVLEPRVSGEPSTPAEWIDFYEEVERLPERDKRLFELMVYEDVEQAEAAALLGVSPRTFKRDWQQVKLRLASVLRGGDDKP